MIKMGKSMEEEEERVKKTELVNYKEREGFKTRRWVRGKRGGREA